MNIVESPRFRKILLMLREELQDRDIPHRNTIRKRLMEMLQEYLSELDQDMEKVYKNINSWYID